LNYIALGGMVVNIVLNLILIPQHGAFGSTIATLITQILVAIVHVMAADKHFKLDYRPAEVGKLFGFAVSCVAIGYLGMLLQLPWVLGITITVALCLLAAIATKLLPVAQFVALLKTKAAS
ncbi:MAG: hypothetical protein RLZZ367_2325, partial [Bacteroidota bacterium]